MHRLLAVVVFAALPFATGLTRKLSKPTHVTLLSIAAGISVSYVFIDLLPELAHSQTEVEGTGLLPYLQRHVYIAALLGLIVAYGVQQIDPAMKAISKRYSMLGATVLFFIVGYSVATRDDYEIQPIALFIIAMGLHYFVVDESLSVRLGSTYHRVGRYLFSAACLGGAILGAAMQIDETTLGILLAFLGGAVILNTIRNELPGTETRGNFIAFAAGAAVYAVILLLLA